MTPDDLHALPPLGDQRWVTTRGEREAKPWHTVTVDLVFGWHGAQAPLDAYECARAIVRRLREEGAIKGGFVMDAVPTSEVDRDLCEATNGPSGIADERRQVRLSHDELRQLRGETQPPSLDWGRVWMCPCGTKRLNFAWASCRQCGDRAPAYYDRDPAA